MWHLTHRLWRDAQPTLGHLHHLTTGELNALDTRRQLHASITPPCWRVVPRQCCEIRRVWTAGAAAALPSLPVHYCSCFAASPVECQCQCAGTHLLSAPCTAHPPALHRPPHLPQTRNRLLWCFPMLSITISHISIIWHDFDLAPGSFNFGHILLCCILTLTVDTLSDDDCLVFPDKPLIPAHNFNWPI